MRALAKVIHPVAGATALLLISGFLVATLLAELAGTPADIVAVKTAIPWLLLVLIPVIALAGGSGFRLGTGWTAPLVAAKRRRMPLIAANGLLVLVPAALFLAAKAEAGAFDSAFYAVQAVELLAGATNLVLLGLNVRDGLVLGGRLRRRTAT